MTDKLTLYLDGMSFQLAGELVYDSPLTRKVRSRCRQSYRLALEDVIFAILFADEIKVPPKFAAYSDGDSPGEDLAFALQALGIDAHGEVLNRCRVGATNSILAATPDRVDALITNPSFWMFRKQVFKSLEILGSAYKLAPEYWKQYMIREGHNQLGRDNSLYDRDAPPSEIRFGAGHYIDRDILNKYIAQEYRTEMFTVLRNLDPFQDVTIPALKKFIDLNAATHIFTYWEPHAVSPELMSVYLRRPYITRALMRSALSEQEQDLFGKLLNTCIPFISYYVLTEISIKSRNDIPAVLVKLRDSDSALIEYRKEFSDACLTFRSKGQDAALQRLLRKTEALLRVRRAPLLGTTSRTAGVSSFGTATMTRSLVPGNERTVRLDNDFSLRVLIADFSNEDYERAFCSLFPECCAVSA